MVAVQGIIYSVDKHGLSNMKIIPVLHKLVIYLENKHGIQIFVA